MPRRRQRALSLRSVFGVILVMGCGGNSTSVEHNEGRGEAGSSGAAATGAGGSSGSGGAGASARAGTGGAMAGGAGASSGSGGTGGSAHAGAGGSPVVEPNIDGEWAMIGFEDPVAVALGQQGSVIMGYGCCVGLNPPSGVECCGPIRDGSIVNGRARFGFSFDVGAVYEYAADVTVSVDGQRMLGSFSRTSRPTAWVRIDPIDLESYGYLSARNAVVYEAVQERVGAYALTLADTTADGSDYSPDAVYELVITGMLPLVWGDLGPFWGGEMSWLADEETLVVGPVPVTDPTFPIALRLRFEGVVLASVEAEMASGARYLFNAALD